MADNSVHVGPWGGSGGRPWEFIADGRITQINIRNGYIIDAISFKYTDPSGKTHQSYNFGGRKGGYNEILLANDEEIIKISGSVGPFEGATVISSLIIVTNTNSYGPYGTNVGTEFNLPIPKGKVVGFHGRHGIYLDSIGVVLAAPSALQVGQPKSLSTWQKLLMICRCVLAICNE